MQLTVRSVPFIEVAPISIGLQSEVVVDGYFDILLGP
jgi:hypothetical protein